MVRNKSMTRKNYFVNGIIGVAVNIWPKDCRLLNEKSMAVVKPYVNRMYKPLSPDQQ